MKEHKEILGFIKSGNGELLSWFLLIRPKLDILYNNGEFLRIAIKNNDHKTVKIILGHFKENQLSCYDSNSPEYKALICDAQEIIKEETNNVNISPEMCNATLLQPDFIMSIDNNIYPGTPISKLFSGGENNFGFFDKIQISNKPQLDQSIQNHCNKNSIFVESDNEKKKIAPFVCDNFGENDSIFVEDKKNVIDQGCIKNARKNTGTDLSRVINSAFMGNGNIMQTEEVRIFSQTGNNNEERLALGNCNTNFDKKCSEFNYPANRGG